MPNFTEAEVDVFISKIEPGEPPMLWLPGATHCYAMDVGRAIRKRMESKISTEPTDDEWLVWKGKRDRRRLLGLSDPQPPVVQWIPAIAYEHFADVLIPGCQNQLPLECFHDTTGGIIHRYVPQLPSIAYGEMSGTTRYIPRPPQHIKFDRRGRCVGFDGVKDNGFFPVLDRLYRWIVGLDSREYYKDSPSHGARLRSLQSA